MPGFFASLKKIVEPNRLRILSLLIRKELCVCELEGILGLSQPLVSAHLRVLQQAGLVHDRREGKWVYFSLNKSIWKEEALWIGPLIKRLGKDPRVRKDRSLLPKCLCERVDGKCINRFQPARS